MVRKMIKESEAVYNYEQVWDKLNNFNKIALTAYSFIKHFSLRTGHIELWGKHGFINIYVDSAPD